MIDTGQLLVALAAHIISADSISSNKAEQILFKVTENDPQLRDAGFRSRFLDWLKSQHMICTTAHVLAEVQGHVLRLKLDPPSQVSFWESVVEFWKEFRVQEEVLRLQDKWHEPSFQEMIGEIGPTDAAVIALAGDCGLPILTADYRTLTQFAEVWGVRAFHLIDLW